jgi:glyoxylase I family protein
MATQRKLPSRLHHTAYVSKNLEETRKFYEDVIGLPLMATWCESDMLFGAERTYCRSRRRSCSSTAIAARCTRSIPTA